MAYAGSVTPPPVPPAPLPPVVAANDWGGFYGGGLVSFDSGTREYGGVGFAPNVFYDYIPNTSYGVFAGYNVQRGAFVFGGELAYTSGGMEVPGFTSPLEYIVDAKARVGYAMGNVMFYGVAGYSMTEWTTGGGSTFEASGFNYGAGVDFMFNDNMFVGIEYLSREMEGLDSTDPNDYGRSTVESVQIRAGWNF